YYINICLKEDFTAIKSQFAPKKCYFFSPLGLSLDSTYTVIIGTVPKVVISMVLGKPLGF
ncbi:hypothetical protein cpu_14520, partial [Carboxydothermus pertinax]